MYRRSAVKQGVRAAAAVSCALFALALLAGCGGAGKQVREKSAREWYDEGQALAAKKKYDEAAKAYREAAKGYRSADLDADVQLALADTSFAQEEYPAAAVAYAEFLRLHPHNARADYAQYRTGLAWQKQLRPSDRSQDAARKAADAFGTVLRSYPRSSWVDAAREGLTAARRHLAEHERYVGGFYQRTGSYAAAAARFETLLRDYGDLGYADEALYRLGRCYEGLRQSDKAAQSFEQLRRDYPGSRFVRELGDQKG